MFKPTILGKPLRMPTSLKSARLCDTFEAALPRILTKKLPLIAHKIIISKSNSFSFKTCKKLPNVDFPKRLFSSDNKFIQGVEHMSKPADQVVVESNSLREGENNQASSNAQSSHSADSKETKDSALITKLIKTALAVKYGLSSGASTSYNISICSVGRLREEAVKNYIRKCGIKEQYALRHPAEDAKSDEFPAKGRFGWGESNSGYSNRVKYLPAAEDKKWIEQKLIQENSVNVPGKGRVFSK